MIRCTTPTITMVLPEEFKDSEGEVNLDKLYLYFRQHNEKIMLDASTELKKIYENEGLNNTITQSEENPLVFTTQLEEAETKALDDEYSLEIQIRILKGDEKYASYIKSFRVDSILDDEVL